MSVAGPWARVMPWCIVCRRPVDSFNAGRSLSHRRADNPLLVIVAERPEFVCHSQRWHADAWPAEEAVKWLAAAAIDPDWPREDDAGGVTVRPPAWGIECPTPNQQ